ncbi:MAG: 23S rRNA (uracil(1939)-C(5))-methyltransferase RlmD [Gammaproteobacteria bacterium]
MGRRKSMAAMPVESGTICDQSSDGRGVVKTDGKTVFVDAAIKGEVVSFKRVRRKRNFDEAELISVEQPAAQRVDPACQYFNYCGGCSLQHLEASAQLDFKQHSLLEALERIGNVKPEITLPPLAGRPLHYRRRARMGAKLVDKKERVLVGFREKRKPYIADMLSCETLTQELGGLIVPLSELLASLSISRQVPQIEMSQGDESLALIFRVLEEPNQADIELLLEFGRAHAATIWLQTGGPQTVKPLEENSPPLFYDLPDFSLRLNFGPLDFIQVNQDMNRRMIAQAMDLLGDISGQRVMDLFCGIGNFSLPLATRAKHVIGIELEASMVAKARDNAAVNKISNIDFIAADLSKEDELPQELNAEFDLVVLDPPRAGAQEVLARVAATGAQRILYVSCHAGSLARDAGILTEQHSYRLKSAGAMDMFPQTNHVEAMALFER